MKTSGMFGKVEGHMRLLSGRRALPCQVFRCAQGLVERRRRGDGEALLGAGEDAVDEWMVVVVVERKLSVVWLQH